MNLPESLELSGRWVETTMDIFLFATEDQKEGMKAFVEKRPPEWKGK